MESRDQALVVKPSGTGIKNRIATPMAIDAARGTILAPCIANRQCFQAVDRVGKNDDQSLNENIYGVY